MPACAERKAQHLYLSKTYSFYANLKTSRGLEEEKNSPVEEGWSRTKWEGKEDQGKEEEKVRLSDYVNKVRDAD